MSRDRKEERLRRNVDISTARWIRAEEKSKRRELSDKEKRAMRKEFERSAERIDKNKLHEVWNK